MTFEKNTCETCDHASLCVESEPVVFYHDCNIKIHDKWEPTAWFAEIERLKSLLDLNCRDHEKNIERLRLKDIEIKNLKEIVNDWDDDPW